ncbi:MAG: hypothetical protein OXC18_05565 [Desulfurellaceae bacterium]|nr:hypothetical protein [Desulfurellaceae bacterium]
MFDPLTLQLITVAAIILFGLYQAVMVYWMFSHGKQAAESSQVHHEEVMDSSQRQYDNAQQRHEEYMTLLQQQHTQAMESLREQRDQSQRQHHETMAKLDPHSLSGDDLKERISDVEQTIARRLGN